MFQMNKKTPVCKLLFLQHDFSILPKTPVGFHVQSRDKLMVAGRPNLTNHLQAVQLLKS